jgi:glycosyltransferase involved in cell wall biosynthesis
MNSLVSVVVPCYNLENYIWDCLESIYKLSYRPIEVIVVDDGSMDDSVRIIKSILKTFRWGDREKFKLIQQKNAGASAARNTGLSHCHGEYVAFIDGDDKVDETYISSMVKAIEGEQVDLCISGIRSFTQEYGIGKDHQLTPSVIRGKENVFN